MSIHDESKVRRGQPKNKGQFRSFGGTDPDASLAPGRAEAMRDFRARQRESDARYKKQMAEVAAGQASKTRALVHEAAERGGSFTDAELSALRKFPSKEPDVQAIQYLAHAAEFARRIAQQHPKAVSVEFFREEEDYGVRGRLWRRAAVRNKHGRWLELHTEYGPEHEAILHLIPLQPSWQVLPDEWRHTLSDQDGHLDIKKASALSPAAIAEHMTVLRQRGRDYSGSVLATSPHLDDYDQYAVPTPPTAPTQPASFLRRLFRR